jgi:hypothetical protein
MSPTDPRARTGVDAVLHALLRQSFGMFPDDLGTVSAELVKAHTTATDVQLLLVDLDQEVLSSFDGATTESVEWSAAGQAFRDQQPVYERHPDGRRLWVPVLDSAERVAVLGVAGGDEVPVDDWITLASLLGELIVTKERYGDHLTDVRRQQVASVAAELRWSLLPPLTFSSSVVGISGILQPSYGIAGDAFDYAVRDGHATVGLFDAMGHGLQASRLANLAIGAFRSGRRAKVNGQELLAKTDQTIADQFGEALFVTAQVLELDLASGVAQIHTAGHPPPILFRRAGSPSIVEVRPGLPLGLGPSTYEATSVPLEPGDALLMVSDGMYEAADPDGSRYGIDRLIASVQDRFEAGDSNPEVLRRVARDVLEFQSGNVRDDTTAVIVRWRPDAVGLPEPPTADRVRDAA